MHRRPLRAAPMRVLAVLVALAVAATFTAYVNQAQAVITTPFDTTFAANANGAIVLRGNASLTCPPAATGCLDALRGIGATSGEALNNNGYNMMYKDVDTDPSTFNSSSADINLPAGSTVLFAGLYWSANTGAGSNGSAAPNAGIKGTIRFRVPGGSGYTTLTTSDVMAGGTAYQSYRKVTDLVAGGGNGTYTVADIQAGTGVDRYAGWALVIAYQNPAEPMRDLRVYDGFGVVGSTQTNVTIPVSGFQTPQYGQVTTKIGTVVYEGDLGKTGDTLQLDSQSMSDTRNPAGNFFNSTVSDSNALVGSRNPNNSNLLGVDIDQFDASGKLGNNATGATLTLTTASGGETFYPGVVTFATDLYAPDLTIAMTGTDTDGGDLLPGDEIEYVVDVRNAGTDDSIDSMLSDAVPAGTTYVPNSLKIGGVAVSDQADLDTGEFKADSAQGTNLFRIGSGATSAAGGRLVPNATAQVSFRVKVDVNTPAGFVVLNKAAVDYTGEHTGRKIAGTSSAAGVTVMRPRADLAAALSVVPSRVQRATPSNPVSYQLTVTNNGTDLEPRATGRLTLPTGVTSGPVPAQCTRSGPDVICDMGPLAPYTFRTLQIDATAGPSADAAAVAGAVATGTGLDAVSSNDTAYATLVVNTAPEAEDDTATTTHHHVVVIPVLDNDKDADHDALTVTMSASVSGRPKHGDAVANTTGNTVTYTPEDGFAGTDTFSYEVSDGRGGTGRATVTVEVADAAPVAGDDSGAGRAGQPVTVTVLDNDHDPNGDPLTITAVTQPAGGQVIFSGGSVTFTPNPSFAGTATFTYTVSDGKGGSTVATVRVDVANATPHAVDDEIATGYRTDVVVPVLTGDTDPNNDQLTVKQVTQPANGTGTVGLTGGVVTYHAPTGFSGVTTFTYTVTDGQGGEDTATVRVTVGNAPPVAADVTGSGPYGRPVAIEVAGAATDPNHDPLHISDAGAPGHGTVAVDGDGQLVYTPEDGFSGTDEFDVEVSDNHGGTDTAHVTVTVENGVPVATPDSVTAETNLALTVPVLANDHDPNGDPLLVTVKAGPAHGTAVVQPDGQVLYTPVAGFRGADSFQYEVADGEGGKATATVSVTVVNSPPIAHSDADSTGPDTAITFDVLANDTDAGHDGLTVTGWTNGAHGTVAPDSQGRLVYTPAPGFAGTDAFTYAIEDAAHGTSTTTVTVTVLNALPIPVNDQFRVRAGVANTLTVLANDTDPNTDQVLHVRAVSTAGHGMASVGPHGTSVTYIPAPGFTGSDTFDYEVTDDAGGLATATVSVVVDLPPVATHDAGTTPSGTAINVPVLANDADPEHLPLTVVAAATPPHGTVAVNPDLTVRYLPAAGFVGADTFSYTIRDAAGNTAIGTATVTVADAAPVARPDLAAVAAGGRTDVTVLGNDGDINPGQTLTVTSVGVPAHGTATRLPNGKIRYVPAAGYTGPDSFSYVISDGQGGTATSTVTVTVTDGVPVALPDVAETPYRHSVTVHPLDNDLDPNNDALRVIGVSGPATGTVTFTPGTVTYRPPAGFSGVVEVEYTLADSDGNQAKTKITITVGTPPAVPDKQAAAPPGTPVTIGLPLVDKNNRPVTVVEVGRPAHGTARLDANGKVIYTPVQGFSGWDTFTYTAEDVNGNLATATVKVFVAGPAAPPVARNDGAEVPVGGSVRITPVANDTDANQDRLTVIKIGKPRHGTAVLSGGKVVYAPAKGYQGGVDSFTYTVSDGHGGTDTATITVNVHAEATPQPSAARLPKTGQDLVTVAGAGTLALLVGAALYWFGVRGGTTVPVLVVGGERRGPGRHRPGRHREQR
ncbi:Ig-like domain-containing protein [Actinoplanes sp. NPDC049265]|uniref:Ig-like domain-containing protein n=1 Tax=Actinoplanes sp. NPDC049265 TaxID=3363902 RepID=UPI0037111441